ncbi:MAG: GNAT family N-acetyltransferase [bacterium]|nr:GNAT family N-acetyltransferase [bacterium]
MEIRHYLKGDEKEIMELDDRALPSKWNPRSLPNWYWKFTGTNPAGHSLIWVAEHKGQMLAHFAAVPYKLKTYDEELLASHSIGALVEVKYQNRGLLKLVGDKLMEDLVAHKIPYTWGFPNKRAHEFENRILGYEDLANFDVWKLEKENLNPTQPTAAFREVKEFNEEFDTLWKTASEDYDIAVVRDKTYLNWRYLQRPDWEYFPFAYYEGETLKGYIVLKLYREEETLRGHIVDIFARRDDKETLAHLINGGLHHLKEKKVDEVTVWIWGSPAIENIFTQKAFEKHPANIPLILRVNTDHKYKDKVKDNTNWYFTMGDSTEIF